MKKSALTLSAIITGFVAIFMVMTAYSQEDIVAIEDSAFTDRQRAVAVFPHDEHNEKAALEECNVCHHIYEDGKKAGDESSEGAECSECHQVKGGDNPVPLMKAYHDMCKGCHLRRGGEVPKTGPVTCGECHPLRE